MRFPDDLSDNDDRDFPRDGDLENESDSELPLGDDTADTDAIVVCPYCAELVTILIDPGGGVVQEYVEDCQVCCQPWFVSVAYQEDGTAIVSVSALDP